LGTVFDLSGSPRPPEVLIRRACHEDVEDILKLWDQARSAAAVTPDDEKVVSRLIDHGAQAPHAHGRAPVTAVVGHQEADAVRLWEAAGYRRDDEIARFVRNL